MNINARGGRLLLGVFLQKDTQKKSEIEIKNLGRPAEVHTSKAAFTPWLQFTLSREAEPPQLFRVPAVQEEQFQPGDDTVLLLSSPCDSFDPFQYPY